MGSGYQTNNSTRLFNALFQAQSMATILKHLVYISINYSRKWTLKDETQQLHSKKKLQIPLVGTLNLR